MPKLEGVMKGIKTTQARSHIYTPSQKRLPTFDDVAIDNVLNPSFLKIRLKASKTDPFRRGVDIVVGKINNKLCPISAMLAYLVVRGNGPGFLFRFHDGRLLTKNRFVDAIRAALLQLGLNPENYEGHSFRIGAATTAGECGLSDSTIQMLGRWSSSAYLVYIKTPREQLAQFSKSTVQSNSITTGLV